MYKLYIFLFRISSAIQKVIYFSIGTFWQSSKVVVKTRFGRYFRSKHTKYAHLCVPRVQISIDKHLVFNFSLFFNLLAILNSKSKIWSAILSWSCWLILLIFNSKQPKPTSYKIPKIQDDEIKFKDVSVPLKKTSKMAAMTS